MGEIDWSKYTGTLGASAKLGLQLFDLLLEVEAKKRGEEFVPLEALLASTREAVESGDREAAKAAVDRFEAALEPVVTQLRGTTHAWARGTPKILGQLTELKETLVAGS